MDLKRVLGLALCAVALALIVWGLFFAKLATVSIKVDLPPAVDARPPAPANPVAIAIAEDGDLSVEGSPSSLETLTRDIAARAPTSDKGQQRIMVHAPENLPYDRLLPVLNRLQTSGWTKVGLSYEPKPAS